MFHNWQNLLKRNSIIVSFNSFDFHAELVDSQDNFLRFPLFPLACDSRQSVRGGRGMIEKRNEIHLILD